MLRLKFNKINKLFCPFNFFIIVVVTTAFFLRFYLLSQNLFFGPEQGRDFLVIKDIVVNHKFTLIGSKTDIEGVFHGPFYYYLSSIPFLISRGSPFFTMFFLVLINSFSVFLDRIWVKSKVV